ncbi:MAG: hypothetical protein ABI444_12410 [Candidatus Kapaibacterium sp.]|jgi:hypothetical protein
MTIPIILYTVFLFLAIFVAGGMVTLQLQHYNLYYLVGRDNFKAYIAGNNKSAAIPSIIPAMLLLIVSIVLVFERPTFMPMIWAMFALALNLVALASSFIWQRKLQDEMTRVGYNEDKALLLLRTNWIRTVAFLLQAAMAAGIVMGAVGK